MIRVYYLGTEMPVKFSDLDSHTVRARDIEKKARRQAREMEYLKRDGVFKKRIMARKSRTCIVKNKSLNVVTKLC